jgi:site-specific recombinase XerD
VKRNTPIYNKLVEYEHYLRNTIKWNHYCTYSKTLEKFFDQNPKVKRPDQITLVEALAWEAWLKERYAPSSAQFRYAVLRAFYTWLVDKGYTLTNPFSMKVRPASDFV